MPQLDFVNFFFLVIGFISCFLCFFFALNTFILYTLKNVFYIRKKLFFLNKILSKYVYFSTYFGLYGIFFVYSQLVYYNASHHIEALNTYSPLPDSLS